MDKTIKLYFYKILKFDSDEDKSKLFFLVKKNIKDNVKVIITLLINYKSFCNSEETLFYIKKLLDGNYDYIDRTLYYLTNAIYCCTLKYMFFQMKRSNSKRYTQEEKIFFFESEYYNILDFKDNTINNFTIDDKQYTDKDIKKEIKYPENLTFYRYEPENELIHEDLVSFKDYYLNLTVRRRRI